METNRRPASASGLALADKKISSLFKQHLPAIPHLFFVPVPKEFEFRSQFPHENRNIPFEPCEIPALQYMTLISDGIRGIGATRGWSHWEEQIYSKTPLSDADPSSTSTPIPVKDFSKKRSQKISFGDYKNYKQTGVKPSPKLNPETPEHRSKQDIGGNRPEHSRNTDTVSGITPMDRGSSFEGGDHKQSAATVISVNAVTIEFAPVKEIERPTVPHPASPDKKDAEKARPVRNGHPPRDLLQSRESNKDPQISSKPNQKQSIKAPMKHPLPPRPRSPPRSNPEQKQQKRPLGSSESPEKRVKIGHGESRTPSNSQKPASRKPNSPGSDAKPAPPKSQKPAAHAGSSLVSPLPKKTVPTAKPNEAKSQTSKPSASSSEKPLNLPPMLSPLPADLACPEPHSSSVAALKKAESGKTTPPKTPSARKDLGSDTIVVRHPHVNNDVTSSSSLTSAPKSLPPFVLPRLLSPDLPEIVEAELLRIQQKSATLNTVEARHEKARLPDAPGVARKTPRPKVGHPAKKSQAESSSKDAGVSLKEEKSSFVVKIPYRRSLIKSIQRILALTQKPRGQMEKLEAHELLARERSSSTASIKKDDSKSEEDIPPSKSRSTKPPVAAATTSTGKKRPSDSTDRNEPAPKRAKLPENVDTVKASTPLTPAFKSPAVNGLSTSKEKSLLPAHKGDPTKSVAMRKVDSNDDQARTPQTQTTSTPTPASAEKPRINGEHRPNPELEKQKADAEMFYPLGTTLKRKMDGIINRKNVDPKNTDPVPVSERERKEGLCFGVESLMAYMLTFHARGRIAQLRGFPEVPDAWEDFLKLWVFVKRSTRQYPELHTLCDQLGAVAREQLNRIYVEGLVKEGANNEKVARDLRENSRNKDALWVQSKRNEKFLKDLGVETTILGPWSSVHDAVAMAGSVLEGWGKREGLEWCADPGFAGNVGGGGGGDSKASFLGI